MTGAVCSAYAQKPTAKPQAVTGETPEQFAKRTQWWRDAKFGMFIHWGVYAVPADATTKDGKPAIAEWFYSNKQMPMKEYQKFAPQFNPVRFDAKQWVQTAKNAGMKYIVITSKHHDGFAIFDTDLNNDWNIVDASPYKRDPIKELAEECKKQGVKLCFYHSIMDWHHPDYIPQRPWDKREGPTPNFDRYVDYMKGQLKELVTKYGPLGVMWFDGEWENTWTHDRGVDLYNYVRSLQPSILINNRVDKGRQGMQGMTKSAEFLGDFGTPEQEIPANGFPDGRLWESCMTMNDTWGFARNDHNWKSAETLIRNLVDIASKGGNYLLNVGPTDLGDFPQAINERLAVMGEWMKVNGPSIYATAAGPFKKLPFNGRVTRKGNLLYLHVFQWPNEGLRLEGLDTPVLGARALLGNEKLSTTRATGANGTVYIEQPARLDPYATVIELRLAGVPKVSEAAVPAVKADASGVLMLKASGAEVHGESARYEQGDGKDNIGFWTNPGDYVAWAVDVPKAGDYVVHVTYACPADNEGSKFSVGPDKGAAATGAVKSTGSWTSFKEEGVGSLSLKPGRQVLVVRATDMPRGAVMNLKCVRLVPKGG
jgi:alpha-L-fucosidase